MPGLEERSPDKFFIIQYFKIENCSLCYIQIGVMY